MEPSLAGARPGLMPIVDAEYILGTDDAESARLGLQHRLWSASSHELWERARIEPGMTIVDVGSGPGQATLDLAEIAGPTGRVIAVEESPRFLKQLQERAVARRLTNVDRVLGDAQRVDELLAPLVGSVDMVYARWLLCFVPDPARVVRGMARLLRPGGRIAIQDYFNYTAMTLAPRSAAFTRVIDAIARSWIRRGGDPDIVGRVPAMLRAEGMRLEHLGVNQRVARPGSTLWHWPDSFWRSYLPRMVAGGDLTEEDRAAFEGVWSRASSDPDAFMQLPPVFDIVAVKA